MVRVEEEVSVIAAFLGNSRLRPLRFRWSNRQINVKDVTYEWITSKGAGRLMHFSVTDGATLYELSFNTGSINWVLEGVEAGI
ncbi:MAG: hypothetical protein HY809_01365 [Nitrospirae bacterium]|nr:hypothetical protein [Nitrospirota bacterium]